MHRPAVALVVAALLEEDLGRHLVQIAALGNQVAVAAMRAGDVVVVVERTHHADGDRFFANVGVERAVQAVLPAEEEVLHRRFPLPAGASSARTGGAASLSEGWRRDPRPCPLVGMSSGGRNFTASPGCQARLPPGPAVASGTVFSNLPPVRPCADTPLSKAPLHADPIVAVAPTDPITFRRVRRSILASCVCIGSNPCGVALCLFRAP